MIRPATDSEIKNWDQLIANNPDGGNVLQGQHFMRVKTHANWTIRYLIDESDGRRAMSVMEKKLPLLGKVWYLPKGPSTTSVDDLARLLTCLKAYAKKQGVFTIKIEPELDYTTDLSRLTALQKTHAIQYNYATVLIDLTPSAETMLMNLPQKGRHAIRRAERDGVTVKKVEPTKQNVQTMYDLFTETARDARFTIRPYSYYQNFYDEYGNDGGLFFAYFNNQPVAGAFAMVLGQKSMYKDGASSRKRQAYGASHLLQWEVIKWAKSHGSLEHDLAGIPPIDRLHDQSHPFYGMGRFKTSFNKTPTQFVGAYNIAVQPFRGWLWQRFLESVWRRLYFKFKKEGWY